ncbi:MAG: lysylphosphatidylglycerol synthase transmembrane domain-containing protein [Chloroflexota bacterium]
MVDTSSSKNNTFWVVVKVILALLLIGFVLTRTNLSELAQLFKSISLPNFLIYVLLFGVLTLLKTWQYQTLTGKDISYAQVLNAIILQNALSNYLATSAGIISYIAMLRAEHGIKISRSIAVFIMIKIGDLMMIWVALIASSLLVWRDIHALHPLVIVLVVGIGMTILFFLLAAALRQKFVIYINSLAARFGLSEIGLVRRALTSLQVFSELEQEEMLRAFAKTILLSAAYFIVSMLWVYVSYMVFEFPQKLISITFVSTLMQVVSYLPVQVFGGLGVTEASALFFWSPFQISQTKFAAFLIGSRLLFYLLNLLPLLYLFLSSILQKRKHQ